MFRGLRTLLVFVLFSALSLFLFDAPGGYREASPLELAVAGRIALAASEQAHQVVTIDHAVPHISTVPADADKADKLVHLFVRERVRGDHDDGKSRKVVLMIHGASVPVLSGFELKHDHYDWALWLAQSGGFDVFMLDHQGSGLSPLGTPPDVPNRNIVQMNDPCNTNPAQLSILIPNPLSEPEPCPNGVNYRFQLTNAKSDWDELDTVVKYIRTLREDPHLKVALVSWSQGSFRVGPYAIQHPDKVESVLFFAPIFNPNGRASKDGTDFDAPVALPVFSPAALFGFPMTLTTKAALSNSWNIELQCEGQREEGIYEFVWSSIMQNDTLGSTWGRILPDGSPEGVMRVRNPFLWGWNNTTAKLDGPDGPPGEPVLGGTVPVLIIYGEHDKQVVQAPFSVTALYNAIQGPSKLMFKVACAGHFMVWERQRRVLHHISKEWLKHGAVEGFTNGSFFVDTEGNLFPQ